MNLVALAALSWRVDAGFPWTRLQANYQVSPKMSVFGMMEQPSFKRVQPNVGLSMTWVDRNWDVNGDLLLGAVIQNAQIDKKGPSGEARITAYRSEGVVRPWTYLGAKESLFRDKWIIQSSAGTRNEFVFDHELTLTGAMGVDFVVREWTIGLGLDLPWVDVPTPSIPGAHLSIGRGGKIR